MREIGSETDAIDSMATGDAPPAPCVNGGSRLGLRVRRPGPKPERPGGFSSPDVAATRPGISLRTESRAMPPTGLEAVYLSNRERLVRFLRARGAGHAAEDIVHDLWINVSARAEGPIANPVAYLFRAADLLMIDRYRSRRQAERRDQAWEDDRQELSTASPSPEREVIARQEAARVAEVLDRAGERRSAIFRRVRIDGVAQRRVAEEFGVSLSTVESDLREVARALLKLKGEIR